MAKTPPFSVCYQYCVGGGGENPGANAVQSDYNQNDSSKLDYIKNRPFYVDKYVLGSVDGIEETTIFNPIADGDNLEVVFEVDGGLLFKSEITVQSGVTEYFACSELVKIVGGLFSLTVQNISQEHDLPYTGTITVSRLIVKPLDDKFIPDSIKYTYEPSKIGEAPVDADIGTAFVNCTEEIKEGDTIMVRGYFYDGVEEYIITVPNELNPDYANQIAESLGRIGNVYLPIPTTVTFTCEIKGEVYKLNKKPVSEATTELYGIVKEIDEALDRVIEKYGLGGFVLPEGAFAITPHIPIEKGLYQFVCFEKEDRTILAEIPEHYSINGGIGTDIESDAQSAVLSHDYPYLTIDNDTTILGGFDRLSGDYTVNFEEIKGTTYVVKVG